MEDERSLVGRLYDTYGTSLYRYAVLLLADGDAAEDVVQQVFATLLQGKPRWEDEASYLRRAVRNECYSQLRRWKLRRKLFIMEKPLLEPLVKATSSEERLALERAIRDLSPEQREVVYLHVFEGLTFREIAEAAQISINTVTARHRYALARLKQLLGSTSHADSS